jgi:hypothetical protein
VFPGAIALCGQTPTFTRYDSFVGQPALALATGDFNRDLKPDLAVTSKNNVLILLGNGDGTFLRGVTKSVGANPVFITVADLNGDQKLDIVTVNNNGAGSSGASVLLGNGDGTFRTSVFYPVTAIPEMAAIGDVNGDSQPDLLMPMNNGQFAVMLGNGDGTFQAPAYTSAGAVLVSLQIGDFNKDGHADVAVLSYNISQARVLIWLGDGSGNFQPAASYEVPSVPLAMAMGDMNGDALPDLVVLSSPGRASVLLGNADGTFQAAVSFPEGGLEPFPGISLADFNHDGKLDVLAGNVGKVTSVSIMPGSGDGTLQAPEVIGLGVWLPSSPNTNYTVVADFNMDGNPDFAVAWSPQVLYYLVSVFLNTTP